VRPFLLDTDVFVWALAAPDRVPEAFWRPLRDPHVTLRLSVASAWELAIESALGRIHLPGDVRSFVADGCRRTGVELLPLDLSHTAEVERLPHHHRDPFDRMLVAQARVESMTLLSCDAAFAPYEVHRLAPR
jgi:PIN domain nuclease of toxin-antitoxin system